MTYIKIRTPEVTAAEEQARKAALQQTFAVNRRAPQAISQTISTPAPLAPATLVPETAGAEVAPTTVSINISLPSMRLPKLSAEQVAIAQKTVLMLSQKAQEVARRARTEANRIPRKQAIQATACLAVAAAIITGGVTAVGNSNDSRREAAVAAAAKKVATASNVTAKPSFAPVTPEDKTALAAGEAGKTAFDTKRQTFSYVDTLRGSDITVSQQPLPANFDNAEAAVTAIAKDLGAKEPVITNKGTGYILTDPKSNQQVVVYSYNKLLLFIKSPFTHSPDEWQRYLEALKQN